MVRRSDIEDAIRRLPPDELRALREWFARYDGDVWERQIERDVREGRLDALKDEALRYMREGRCKDL